MAPRYEVTVMVATFLRREIDARTEDAAEDTARYLYGLLGKRLFKVEPEDIIDVIVEPKNEGAAS